MTLPSNKKLILSAVLATLAAGAAYAWVQTRHQGYGEQFVSGNGRTEATEIDIATKLPGRLQDVLVNEGDFVRAGQVLAHSCRDACRTSWSMKATLCVPARCWRTCRSKRLTPSAAKPGPSNGMPRPAWPAPKRRWRCE
jgi:hypothetical protein